MILLLDRTIIKYFRGISSFRDLDMSSSWHSLEGNCSGNERREEVKVLEVYIILELFERGVVLAALKTHKAHVTKIKIRATRSI